MRSPSFSATLLAPALLVHAATAQDATALLRTDDFLAKDYATQQVVQLYGTDVNALGGYAVRVLTSGSMGQVDLMWGTPDGTLPTVLVSEETITSINLGGYYDGPYLSNSGKVGYEAWSTNYVHIFRDATRLFSRGDSVPGIGGVAFTGFAGPYILDDGDPVFVGWMGPTNFSSDRAGLFRGNTALLAPNTTPPNMPAVVDYANVPFAVADSGNHWIMRVFMTSEPTDADTAMMMDGAGLLLGGALVREGDPVPASIGGLPGETWDEFGYAHITENHWLFTANTAGVADFLDEVIVLDGQIWRREGDVVDGLTLVGDVQGVRCNDVGQVAYAWDVEAGTGAECAMFLDGELLAKEGDALDWDGDGIAEQNTTVAVFPFQGLSITDTGLVYTAIMVSRPGSTETVLYRFNQPLGDAFCTANPNSTGFPAGITASGTTSVVTNDLVLRASPVPLNQFGLFFYGPEQQVSPPPLGDGLLCLGAGATGLGRLPVEFSNLETELVHAVDFGNPPTQNTVITAGSTWNFQCWFRDPTGGPAGNSTSSGLSLTFTN